MEALVHVNVVKLYLRPSDYPTDPNGGTLIFMECCECGNLKTAIKNAELVYNVATVITWATGLYDGLSHIAEAGIVHHDIKPAKFEERWDSVAELKELPLKYIFNPNKPPTGAQSDIWGVAAKQGTMQQKKDEPMLQDFLDAHAFYERAFRYLMYWQLEEMHYVLYLLIGKLLNDDKWKMVMPKYPFFVMGNGHKLGAMLRLWDRDTDTNAQIPKLIGRGFHPVSLDDEALRVENEHYMKTSRRDCEMEANKQIDRKWDFVAYADFPDAFAGVMMVDLSDLRAMLQSMFDRLRKLVKMGNPYLSEEQIQLQNERDKDHKDYKVFMATTIDAFWNSRKITKVLDIHVEKLKAEINAFNAKRR
ncbi:unnamed protein product, partial [Mesorhabditis spiculigera]